MPGERARPHALAALALATLIGCGKTGEPVLAPAMVVVGDVTSTAFRIEGLGPSRLMTTSGEALVLAPDFAAVIGGTQATPVAADASGVTLAMPGELAVGSYSLELSARGAHWLVTGALDVIPRDVAVDASASSDTAGAAACDAGDPTLVACYAFDGDGLDGSSHHLDATLTGATFEVGHVGMAIRPGKIEVAESSALDVSGLTIEAWISPTTLPTTGTRMSLVDNQLQYGLFLKPGGALSCTTVATLEVPGVITAGRWTHVACTDDGATIRLFVDGLEVGSGASGGAISTAGSTGISIGADNPSSTADRFDGALDDVRLYSVARTQAQLCADTKLLGC